MLNFAVVTLSIWRSDMYLSLYVFSRKVGLIFLLFLFPRWSPFFQMDPLQKVGPRITS